MNVRRTPWWYYPCARCVGLIAGIGLGWLSERFTASLIGAPWIVCVILILLGLFVLALTWQVRKYVKTKPNERRTYLDPGFAVRALVLAKSLGIAATVLVGWYGGQILISVHLADIPFFAQAIRECIIAGIICVINVIIGIVGERLCQLPPTQGPEHPDVSDSSRDIRTTHSRCAQPVVEE